MAKDLIIGVCSNYKFNDVLPWVRSSKECGFKGDVVLVTIEMDEETNKQIEAEGVIVVRAKRNSDMMIHMERFYHVHKYLSENPDYVYVVSTDVRDVIFQNDPSEWFEFFTKGIVSSGEAILIKDEEWNRNNIIKNFGEYFYNEFKEKIVQCVGVLGGQSHYMKDLCFYIYQMSLNRPDWVADQSAYNVIVHSSPWKQLTHFANLADGWAINAHVTNYDRMIDHFTPLLLEERPVFENGRVKDRKTGLEFYIVHQYDRVKEWKKYYEDKYGIKINSQYTPDEDVIVINTGV
jgi:hypothetical protein